VNIDANKVTETIATWKGYFTVNGVDIDTTEVEAYSSDEASELATTVFLESGHDITTGVVGITEVK